MAFNQSYKKVVEVVNIENSSEVNSGDSFKQSYDDVLKVINTVYDNTQLNTITPLVEKIISLNEDQTEQFYNEIVKRSSDTGSDAEAYRDLKQQLDGKNDKKKGILECIKAGTITLTFANSLLTVVKTILGLVVG